MIITEDTAKRIAAALEQLLDVVREIKPQEAARITDPFGWTRHQIKCGRCGIDHWAGYCPAKPLPPLSPTGRWI